LQIIDSFDLLYLGTQLYCWCISYLDVVYKGLGDHLRLLVFWEQFRVQQTLTTLKQNTNSHIHKFYSKRVPCIVWPVFIGIFRHLLAFST